MNVFLELIEHTRVTNLSTWHGVCSIETQQTCATIGSMKRVHVVFHDGGGGHRNAAVALQTVISQQQRDWQVELIQFQDLTDRLDVLRKLTGIRIQQQYNIMLQKGWTLGSTQLLRVLQLSIRIFHRRLVNLLETGMILRPDFYVQDNSDPVALRREMGLREGLPTAIVLFGGHGSNVMYDITEKLDVAGLPLQLILICGRNEELAGKLRTRQWKLPVHVIGFTKEVHRLMRAADFLIGKPGPGSIAEAMVRHLPVLIECNAWTLPQERYNAEWVKEKGVGIVLRSFGDVAEGVKRMLEPATLAAFRKNVATQQNHAVFEIPEILAKLLGEPNSITARIARVPVEAETR